MGKAVCPIGSSRHHRAPGDSRGAGAVIVTGWACISLLFAGAVGRFRPASPTALLRFSEAAPIMFEAPLVETEAGVDRRGEHVAMLTADGAWHAVTLQCGAVHLTACPTPCGPFGPGDIASLHWRDTDQDGRLEGIVAGSRRSAIGPSREVALTSVDGRWRPLGPPTVLGPPPPEPDLRAVQLDGRPCRLRSGPGASTSLNEDETGACLVRVAGEVLAVRDVDGDGHDDLLTAGDTADGTVRLRLLRRDGARFDEVFTVTVDQATPSGPAGRFLEVADLDGDGRADLIVFEPRARRVRCWRWAGG